MNENLDEPRREDWQAALTPLRVALTVLRDQAREFKGSASVDRDEQADYRRRQAKAEANVEALERVVGWMEKRMKCPTCGTEHHGTESRDIPYV